MNDGDITVLQSIAVNLTFISVSQDFRTELFLLSCNSLLGFLFHHSEERRNLLKSQSAMYFVKIRPPDFLCNEFLIKM